MIVTRLEGGLGNQLFQFAAGRAVTLRTGSTLALDLNAFKNGVAGDASRIFELPKLGVRYEIATKYDIGKAMGRTAYQAILPERLVRKVWGRARTWIRETGPESIKELRDAGRSAYLSGYWQSELYFYDFRDQIRSELNLATRSVVLKKSLLDIALSTDSVSLHVRRGDYVQNPKTNAYHGTCTAEYYSQAVDKIRTAVSQPMFLIFSDDIEWCREHLSFGPSVLYVDRSFGVPAEAEMLIMSKCRHNIIANSSFSWWGAWLNDSREKIVIAPKKWFNVEDIFEQERLPASWCRL